MEHDGVVRETARWTAFAVCLLLVPLWVLFTYRGLQLDDGLRVRTIVLIGVLVCLALLGAVASWRRSVGWLLTVAAVSFVPIGFYFLLSRGLARLIGAFYVVLLLAAGAARLGRRIPTRDVAGGE